MTNEELEKLRNISIKTILGRHENYGKIVIKCVFHDDRTPSLLIDNSNGFYCFGCGKNGQGAVDFCMALGATFKEAVEELKKYD